MLSEWLNHPAVQSGIAPFIAALITAELFNRLRLSGLAVIAGFAATVYLVADFNFEFRAIPAEYFLFFAICISIVIVNM